MPRRDRALKDSDWTDKPELQGPNSARSPGPRRLLSFSGTLLATFGAVYTTMSIMHQLRNRVAGRSYYDWIALGIMVALAGFGLVLLGRGGRAGVILALTSAALAATLVAVLGALFGSAVLGRG